MYNNAAYDFGIFKENEVKKQAQVFELPTKRARLEKKHVEKLKFFGRCLSLILSSALTIGGILFGQAKLVECNFQAETKAAELEEFKIRNKQLEIKLSEASAAENSQNAALDKCVETVTISAGDKAVIK